MSFKHKLVLIGVGLVVGAAIGAAVLIRALPTDCNVLVSMSQGRQVYNGVQFGDPPASPLEVATGEEWMLLFKSGKTLAWWTNPVNWTTLAERHRCGTDGEVDSVVFIFDPFGSGQASDDGTTMRTHLAQVVSIVASRYPVATPYLTMLVGAENHVVCQKLNPFGQLTDVRASKTHAQRIGQMTMSEVGPDLDIPCSGYADTVGHLTDAGAAEANVALGDWFVNQGIPETIPHPGIREGIGYTIGVHASDPQRTFWIAPYLFSVPYVDDAGWLPGDRIGYSCAYGFLQYRGEIIGRFTFRRVFQAQSYIVINDKFMVEGQRFYDGTPTPPGTVQVPISECPPPPDGYLPSTAPDERPLIVFWSGNTAIELRDYRGVQPGPGVTFELIDSDRVTVLARENGVPAVVVYYDPLGSGRVTAHLDLS